VAIGQSNQSSTTGSRTTLIGAQAGVLNSAQSDCSAFGYQATCTGNNQFVVGSAGSPITTMYIGEGVTSTTPSDVGIFSTNLGGGASDAAGSNLTIASGAGSGNNVTKGSLFFATPIIQASGNTPQPYQNSFEINPSGLLRALNIHNNTTAQGTAAQQDIRSGTYTPTIANVANTTAQSATQAQWNRVGNVVTVSGKFTADPDVTVTPTAISLTLPVTSNCGAIEDAAGVAFAGGIAGQGGAIQCNATTDVAEVHWVAADVTSQAWSYTYTYEVI